MTTVELITPHQVQAELIRLIALLDQESKELSDASHEYALAALHYAQAKEEVTARHHELGPTKLAGIVDAETAVAKAKRQIADYNRSDAVTEVVNCRLQISAWQTMAKLIVSEMEMAT